MSYAAHLQSEELVLAPAQEWVPGNGGWHFLQASKGQAYWLDHDVMVELVQQGLVILPPSRHGVLRASQLGTAIVHVFRFCPEQLISLLTLSERRFLERQSLAPRIVPVVLDADHPASRLMAEVCACDSLTDGLEVRALLLRVVSLCFSWDRPRKAPPVGGYLSASKRIQALMRQWTETEMAEQSPAALAARCGCSTSHFQRLFLQCFGVSIQDRQQELRLMKAKELLAGTQTPIQDIALQAGFKRVSTFCRLFKKQFGQTPTAFRSAASSPLHHAHPSTETPVPETGT